MGPSSGRPRHPRRGPLDRDELLQPCEGLLDSGADMTAIPSNLVEQLGLVPVDSVLLSHGGEATAIERDVFAAAVDVPVLGRSIVRVLATADPFACWAATC